MHKLQCTLPRVSVSPQTCIKNRRKHMLKNKEKLNIDKFNILHVYANL